MNVTLGQQVNLTLPGTDEQRVLAFVTAVPSEKRKPEDDGAVLVDLAVFPPREQPRALQDVRLYDSAGGCAEAREVGHVLSAHTELDGDATAESSTGGRASKGKAATKPETPPSGGTGAGSGI